MFDGEIFLANIGAILINYKHLNVVTIFHANIAHTAHDITNIDEDIAKRGSKGIL